MRSNRFLPALIAAGTLLSLDALAQDSFLKRLGTQKAPASLTQGTISDGLRDALKVGIERTVAVTGKDDGYFKNDKIKILPPKTLQRIDKPLRAAGYGPQIDEFTLSMNRAAEKAAPVAKDIFVNAIAEMNIEDAKAILHGSDTSATDYLNKHTRERLTAAFLPHVKETMGQFDVMKKYNAVVEQTASIPFAKSVTDANIEKYTVEKALDGLFYMLGQEEKKIRQDPTARTTDLLKKVFAK